MTPLVDLGYYLIVGTGLIPGEPGEDFCPPSCVYYVSGETQLCLRRYYGACGDPSSAFHPSSPEAHASQRSRSRHVGYISDDA